jgi:hypothetical protein
MEVCNHCVDQAPSMPWLDKEIRKPAQTLRISVGPGLRERLHRPRRRRPYGYHAAAAAAAISDSSRSIGGDITPLAVDTVVLDPFGGDWPERVEANVKRDLRPADPSFPQGCYKLASEVKTRRRCGRRTRRTRIDSLVARRILEPRLDVWRQGRLPIGIEPDIRVLQEANLDLPGTKVSFDHGRRDWRPWQVSMKFELHAGLQPSGGPGERVPNVSILAQEQQFDVAPAWQPLSAQAGRDHAAVVGDQKITRRQPGSDLIDVRLVCRSGDAVEHQQPRPVPPLRRRLRD